METTPVKDDGPPVSNQRAFSRVLPGSPSARPLVTRSYLSGWSVPPAPSPLPAQSPRPPRPVARTLRPSPAPRAAAFIGPKRHESFAVVCSGLGEQWNRKYGRRLDLGPPE